jgi:hypothetical protein
VLGAVYLEERGSRIYVAMFVLSTRVHKKIIGYKQRPFIRFSEMHRSCHDIGTIYVKWCFKWHDISFEFSGISLAP